MSDLANGAIADALDELGDLYELDGAVIHRVLAYHKAAKAIRDAPVSVAQLARAGTLTTLPGIGATLAAKIQDLLDSGARGIRPGCWRSRRCRGSARSGRAACSMSSGSTRRRRCGKPPTRSGSGA
jgi:hypothetical protein